MREIWKQFRQTGYFVSSQGRVRGISGRILRPLVEKRRGGYLSLIVCYDGQKRRHRVNRMVCEAFKGPPPSPDHQADHRDKDVTNNWATNLRWLPSKKNRAQRHDPRGEECSFAILRADQVRAIRRHKGPAWRAAPRFGISPRHFNQVRSGVRWGHLQ